MRTTQLCPPTGGRCNGVTLGRATSPTQLWRADPEGANCRQLFAVLRRVSLINENSLLSQLNCLLLNWGKSPQFFFLFFWIWDMERLKRLAEAALVSSLSLPTRAVFTCFGSVHSRPSFSFLGSSEKSKRLCAPAAVCRLISPFRVTPTRQTENLEPQQSPQSDINSASSLSPGG